MANRIIKETILTSPNFNELSVHAERHFYRLLLTVDDYGCFEATPLVVKGKCYPLQLRVVVGQISKWQQELSEKGIVKYWKADDGRIYGQFVSFDRHNAKYAVTDDGKPTRHRRKTPEPPTKKVSFASLCQTLPNPNPNPNPNITSQIENLLASFPTSLQTDVKTYWEVAASKNKSKQISEGRRLTLTRELVELKADQGEFEYAIRQAIKYNAPNINYIKAVIKNKKDICPKCKNKGRYENERGYKVPCDCPIGKTIEREQKQGYNPAL